jgi:hypothetical protein
MDNDLLRNGSGYVDFTAYKALQNYQKGENIMEYNRGEIFEYSTNNYDKKKAVILSADFRKESRFISILVLQDEAKGAVNVPVKTASGIMYADCGLVSFCTNERLGDFLRITTEEEMQQIDEGIAKCLGIEQKTVEITKEVPVFPMESTLAMKAHTLTLENKPAVEAVEEFAAAKAEANVYKNLYEQLLAKMIG